MIRRVAPILALAALAACGSGSSPDAAPAATSTTGAAATSTSAPTGSTQPPTADVDQDRPAPSDAPTTTGAVLQAPEALRFSAPLVGGDDIELTTLAGRPVLLWFWAPW